MFQTESKAPHKTEATPILKSTPKSSTPSKIPLTKALRDNHQKLVCCFQIIFIYCIGIHDNLAWFEAETIK